MGENTFKMTSNLNENYTIRFSTTEDSALVLSFHLQKYVILDFFFSEERSWMLVCSIVLFLGGQLNRSNSPKRLVKGCLNIA